MGNLHSDDAVIILTVVSGILIFVCAIGVFFYWKFYKNNLEKEKNYTQRQQELDLKFEELRSNITQLGSETDNAKKYNMAMGKLMLEEQRSYLYSVALQIDALVKKNELLVMHGLIDNNLGINRNSQLLVLKGGLQQYADSLSFTPQ